MANYGAKISVPGVDVKTAAPKDMVSLSYTESHKVFFKGLQAGQTYTHNLGYKPICFGFICDSATLPTFYQSARVQVNTTTVTMPSGWAGYYFIIFYEGVA